LSRKSLKVAGVDIFVMGVIMPKNIFFLYCFFDGFFQTFFAKKGHCTKISTPEMLKDFSTDIFIAINISSFLKLLIVFLQVT